MPRGREPLYYTLYEVDAAGNTIDWPRSDNKVPFSNSLRIDRETNARPSQEVLAVRVVSGLLCETS